jgi:hypothetical protein
LYIGDAGLILAVPGHVLAEQSTYVLAEKAMNKGDT